MEQIKSRWIVNGQALPQVIAQKYDVDLPTLASREIFESIKDYVCNGCVLKEDDD